MMAVIVDAVYVAVETQNFASLPFASPIDSPVEAKYWADRPAPTGEGNQKTQLRSCLPQTGLWQRNRRFLHQTQL